MLPLWGLYRAVLIDYKFDECSPLLYMLYVAKMFQDLEFEIAKNAVLTEPLCYRPVMNEGWRSAWCQKPLLPLTPLGWALPNTPGQGEYCSYDLAPFCCLYPAWCTAFPVPS